MISKFSISFKSSVLLILFITVLFNIINFIMFDAPNRCEMTYMFQKPQFIPIFLGNQVQDKFPKYNLYAYGEGAYAESLRLGAFDGVPVLFVPGHGGSYKQVRSLASVALRMITSDLHFNYFTIDYNEEFSAFYGSILNTQTQFLKEAVNAILKIYFKRQKDVSLILIGHSIGGVLCRSLLTLDDFEFSSKINLILTLASPHKAPVIPLVSQITFYENVNSYWNQNRDESLAHINVISIGGGFNDKLIRPDLTQLTTNHSNDLSVFTSSIEDVWISTDHLCIVWCRQLIVKLNRLLFDLVDKDLLKPMDNRNKIINYHLLYRSLGKDYPKFRINEYKIFLTKNDWMENKERQFSIRKNKVLTPINILIPLFRTETIVINYNSNNNNYYNWIYACNATKLHNLTYCDSGLNLYNYSKLIPSHLKHSERRLFKIALSTLINKGFSHLLISIETTTQNVNINVDRFTTALRTKEIILPSLLKSILWSTTLFDIYISDQATFYDLKLFGIEQIWNVYWFQLETTSCYSSAKEKGFLYLTFPWSNEEEFKFVTPKKDEKVKMMIKTSVPRPSSLSSNKIPHLYLTVDQNCGYRLQATTSFTIIFGQLVRHFGIYLLLVIISVLIIILTMLFIQIKFK